MAILISSAYLAPISFYAMMANDDEVIVERFEHYVKQTYRNRCVIASECGPLSLTVPTEKNESPKSFMRDIRISEHGNWQHLHWNAIESAYRNSPFFEYYADDFIPFYRNKFTFLLDFNQQLCRLVNSLIGIHPQFSFTQEWEAAPSVTADLRTWIEPSYKAETLQLNREPYYQVFAQKNGFIPNLSIIDLLFNMGPESILVLQKGFSRIISKLATD